MTEVILVINSGSSSIKFALYRLNDLSLLARGQIADIYHSSPSLWALDIAGGEKASTRLEGIDKHNQAIRYILDWVVQNNDSWVLAAAGHRVVHGGAERSRPASINSEVLLELRSLEPLAPQHQPHNLAAIDAIMASMPNLPQVASFDTAFHASQPPEQRLIPLAKSLRDKGLMKYGFHGLSYEYLVRHLAEHTDTALPEKLIIAHLGNGASACAVLNGKSVASTMGFSTLDGLVMGSRSGSIDPGVLLHLLQTENFTAKQLADCLYEQSGLLGLSGISSDVRQLESSADEKASLALDVYVSSILKHIASLGSVMQGIDALVFSGGVGENSVLIRGRVLRQLAWLGCDIDETANKRGDICISTPDSKLKAYVIPTNEELIIAEQVRGILNSPARTI